MKQLWGARDNGVGMKVSNQIVDTEGRFSKKLYFLIIEIVGFAYTKRALFSKFNNVLNPSCVIKLQKNQFFDRKPTS